MKKRSLRNRILAFLIVILTAFDPIGTAVTAFAEQESYVSEIRVGTKESLKKAGYTVSSADFGGQLGSGNCIGYKTTHDRSKAITDVRAMHMYGGFEVFNLDTLMNESALNSARTINGFMTALEEFRANYRSGSVPAKLAYKTLNYLMVPGENGSADVYLGDYLLSSKRTKDEIRDLLLISDVVISTYIMNQLTLGVADDLSANLEEGADAMNPVAYSWLDRLVENGTLEENYTDADDLAEDLNNLDKQYYQDTFSIIQSIRSFASDVTGALSRHSDLKALLEQLDAEAEEAEDTTALELAEGKKESNQDAEDANVLLLYDYLNARDEEGNCVYPYGTKADGSTRSFGEFLVEIGSMDEETQDQAARRLLYPLIVEQGGTTPMTEGQWAILKATDFLTFLRNTVYSTADYSKMIEDVTAQGEELMTLNDGKQVSVWYGVNYQLFKSGGVYMTNEAIKTAAANEQYGILTKTTIKQNEKQRRIFQWMLNMGFLAVFVSVGACVVAKVGALLAGALTIVSLVGGSASIVAGAVALCSALVTVSIVVVGIALVAAAVLFLVWLFGEKEERDQEEEEKKIKMLDIPNILIDARYDTDENLSILEYHVVEAPGGGAQNLNRGYDNTPWLVLYTTTNDNAGEPLSTTAADGSSIDPFAVRSGSCKPVDQYCNLAFFEENVAANLHEGAPNIIGWNGYIPKYNVPVFGYFHRSGDAETPNNTLTGGKYISNLILYSAESERAAVDYIRRNKGYEVVYHNLMSGTGLYTYIGYKTTNTASNALTDIRVAYNAFGEDKIRTGSVNFNGVQYAAFGHTGLLGLYATTNSNCGSPILADSLIATGTLGDAPEGYEPVNLFSGGPAFDFNAVSKSWTPGIYVGNGNETSPGWDYHAYVYFHPESIESDGTDYIGGLAFFDKRYPTPGWTRVSDVNVGGNQNNNMFLYYSTTKNKKRAITDVKYYQAEPNAQGLAYNITYGSEGQYVAVDVYSQSPRLYEEGSSSSSERADVRLLRSSHAYRSNLYYEGGLVFDGCGSRIGMSNMGKYNATLREREYRRYSMLDSDGNETSLLIGTNMLCTALYIRGYVSSSVEPLKEGDLVGRTTSGYDASSETPVRNFTDAYSETGVNIAYRGAGGGYRFKDYAPLQGTLDFQLESSSSYGDLYLFLKRPDSRATRETYIKSVTVAYAGNDRSEGTRRNYGAMFYDSDGNDQYDTPYDTINYKLITQGPGQLIKVNLASGAGGRNGENTTRTANSAAGTDEWAEAVCWEDAVSSDLGDKTEEWEIRSDEDDNSSGKQCNSRPYLNGDYSTEVAYLWVTYTNVVNQAVSDILIYATDNPATAEPEKKMLGETVNAKLGANEGWKENPKDSTWYYLYSVYNNGHEITDLKFSQDAFLYGYETCLDSEGAASGYSKYFLLAKHAKNPLSKSYVYKIILAEGETEREAQINLLNSGCSVCVPYNINTESGKPTYLGFKTTSKTKNAYTGLLLWNTKQEENVKTVEYGRLTYNVLSKNLNSGVKGFFEYLFATRDTTFAKIFQGADATRYITDICFYTEQDLNEYAKDPSKLSEITDQKTREYIEALVLDFYGKPYYWTLVRGKGKEVMDLNAGSEYLTGNTTPTTIYMYVHYSDNYFEASGNLTGSTFLSSSMTIMLLMGTAIILIAGAGIYMKRRRRSKA